MATATQTDDEKKKLWHKKVEVRWLVIEERGEARRRLLDCFLPFSPLTAKKECCLPDRETLKLYSLLYPCRLEGYSKYLVKKKSVLCPPSMSAPVSPREFPPRGKQTKETGSTTLSPSPLLFPSPFSPC